MQEFMDQNFLLQTEVARNIYHSYASTCPVIDYHCHISPQEIAEDRHFENITQLWLGGDHYKWRLMRSAGVEERLISGDASDRDKFFAWANVLGYAIGNPLYHWSHLELQRYFDYHGTLNHDTASNVWDLCNEKLSDASMSARMLIRESHVTHICTTDDPVDSLVWHKKMKEDAAFDTKVLPAFRPDSAMTIEKVDFTDYLKKLEEASKMEIRSFSDLKEALERRIRFFSEMGCRTSDHGLRDVMYAPSKDSKVEEIFQKRLAGTIISDQDVREYQTAFMLFMGEACTKYGWVMQLHYGCKRDNNDILYRSIGANTGFDCIDNVTSAAQTVDFLNALHVRGHLPRTILYSLNPTDNAYIDTIIGCFQDASACGKIQHGSAWWFNDHKAGMEAHMTSLGNSGYLAGFVGMLTDSRSFLSYTRHEYFRRIFCNHIGTLVENGEFPYDEKTLAEIVRNVSYYNALRYFDFDKY